MSLIDKVFGKDAPWGARMCFIIVFFFGLMYFAFYFLAAVWNDWQLSNAADAMLHPLEIFGGTLIGMMLGKKNGQQAYCPSPEIKSPDKETRKAA